MWHHVAPHSILHIHSIPEFLQITKIQALLFTLMEISANIGVLERAIRTLSFLRSEPVFNTTPGKSAFRKAAAPHKRSRQRPGTSPALPPQPHRTGAQERSGVKNVRKWPKCLCKNWGPTRTSMMAFEVFLVLQAVSVAAKPPRW